MGSHPPLNKMGVTTELFGELSVTSNHLNLTELDLGAEFQEQA